MRYIIPTIEKYTFNDREDKTIHLGIETNIICIDDRIKFNSLGYYIRSKHKFINDTTATLYLGKITFKDDKNGNKIPQYIPSKITESSFEDLNLFWLNEINPNPPKRPEPKFTLNATRFSTYIDEEDYQYLNIHYFRIPKNIVLNKDSLAKLKADINFRIPKNIVLNKEQIMSYFTELHSTNTKFIKDFIDSINQYKGIKAYYLGEKVEENLRNMGIKDRLSMLDYLKQTKQNRIIPYFDGLFYPYLVWSLREYLIPYFSGRYQDENNLLFNMGAYKAYNKYSKEEDSIFMPNPYHNEFPNEFEILMFYSNITATKKAIGYLEGYEDFIGYYGLNFKNFVKDLKDYKGFQQNTPNKTFNKDLREYYFKPSPLGNYYFELDDNQNTYLPFFHRIYPNIDNPPKGWDKEMMKKLELRLE